MTHLVLHIRVINPALIDLFCRCLYPAAFIFVVVVMPRSLSVPVVIMDSDIVRVNVAIKLELNHLNGRVKSTNTVVRDDLIMPLDNNDSELVKYKK